MRPGLNRLEKRLPRCEKKDPATPLALRNAASGWHLFRGCVSSLAGESEGKMADKEAPIIICGAPRSGTRMLVRILDLHPQLVVTNEFPFDCMGAALNLFSRLDGYMAEWPDRSEKVEWLSSRADMMIDIWLGASSAYTREKAKNARRFANKTPGNEHFFEDFEKLFAACRPSYIFCVRHPERVLKSLKNMPWNNRSLRANWKMWKSSVLTLQTMERLAPGRVMRVQLDRPGDADLVGLGERLYRFLGLDLDQSIRLELAGMGAAQPLSEVRSEDVVDLTDREMRIVRGDRRYGRLVKLLGYEGPGPSQS